MTTTPSDPDPTIRPALPADETVVANLLHAHPSEEAAGIVGGLDRARELSTALFLAGAGRTARDELWLAQIDGRPVGALQARRAGSSSFPIPILGIPRLLRILFGLYSVSELAGLVRRVRLRSRLDFPVPEGSYHVIELHVDPEQRGRGIGGALLRHAEHRARASRSERINLTTAISNPARRLYERNGYRALGERTIPGYEALCGTPGRVFYDKSLDAGT